MIKRICDRCGMVCKDDMISAKSCKERNGVLLVKMQPCSTNVFWYYADETMSLCPFCMEKLQKWLKGGEMDVN